MTSEFSIAVHCLVFLSHKGCSMSSEKIAENVCTNPTRIRKILTKLKKSGLLRTREGLAGGFCLCRPAADITLADVLDAVGEPPVSVSWRTGSEDRPCRIASGMAGEMDALFGELNAVCRQHLKSRTVQEIENRLFANTNRPTQ